MTAQTVLAYVDSVNNHNIEVILTLITDDHKLIDARGHEVSDKVNLKIAWTTYFNIFPDYKIEVEQLISEGRTYALFGIASGSYEGIGQSGYWRLPAAWRAILNGHQIELWQVYADMSIPNDIIHRLSPYRPIE